MITHEHRDGSPLDPTTRERRTRHATRFVAEAEPGLGLGVPAPPGTAAGEWLSLTVLPVSTAHDEHLFIRAMQAYEPPGAYRDFERAFAEVPADPVELRDALRSLEAGHRRWNTARRGFARRLPAAETAAAA